MTAPITQVGQWRIRPSVTDGKAAVSCHECGESETLLVETHADLALLRDAITEYLRAVGAER